MVKQRLEPELAMKGYVKGAPSRLGLRPPWLPYFSIQVCEWVAKGTGHRWPLREGAAGLSQWYPLLHIPDILLPYTGHPVRRLYTVFTHIVTYSRLWPGQGLPFSKPPSLRSLGGDNTSANG